MKKRAALVTMLLLCLLLSGCCLSHEWQAATCTVPETCSKCGETQGEALGHSWQAATCTAAETCSKCGETQGEALAHSWLAANYQQPERCSVCGEENGEPLTPGFVEHGLEVTDVDISGAYKPWEETTLYTATCSKDKSKSTVGELTLYMALKRGYITIDGMKLNYPDGSTYYHDEEILAAMGVEPLDGYRLICAYGNIHFSDENYRKYGWYVKYCYEDYYTIEAHETGTVEKGLVTLGELEYRMLTYPVSIDGEKKPAYFLMNSYSSLGASEFYFNWYFYIPDGYDGTVVGFVNAADEGSEEGYIYDKDEDLFLYRIIT